MKVSVLKEFTAYLGGTKKTLFKVGDANIPKADVEACNMVANGLIEKPKE